MFLEVVIHALSEMIGVIGWGAWWDLLLEEIALFSDFLEGYVSVLFLFYLCVLLLDVFLLLEDEEIVLLDPGIGRDISLWIPHSFYYYKKSGDVDYL